LIILEDCQNQLNVKIEHNNRFLFTIIFKKNCYIAWTGNPTDRLILNNLDGMSRKYPRWIKQQIEKIATYLITNSNDVDDVIPVIKQAFEDLDYGRFEARDMKFTEQLDKNPNQYRTRS
jgi:DNA polymerase elongation subunit (family B)